MRQGLDDGRNELQRDKGITCQHRINDGRGEVEKEGGGGYGERSREKQLQLQ